ncbi:MAG: hypothetical protein JW925_13825 [Syntrophaceae bacterium]|nr:hypothetical protein [Syntrophaceae bacterium]
MKIHLLFLTAILALFLGCDTGTGPEEETGPDPEISHGVTGTVTFTGEWPANAAEVRPVTSMVFPPEMDDIIFGDSIPADTSTYNYEFELDPGTYKIFGIAWRNEGADWNYPSFCGTYYSKEDDDSLAPSFITIADENAVVKRVNIGVNRSKAHVVSSAKITGSVTFNGAWPSNVTEARVIATTKLDISTLETPSFNDLAFSNTIAQGTTAYNYEIPAFPGQFVATFVIFFKENEKLSIADVLYSSDHGGLDMALPGEISYTVELDQTVTGPDFTVTF